MSTALSEILMSAVLRRRQCCDATIIFFHTVLLRPGPEFDRAGSGSCARVRDVACSLISQTILLAHHG
ncbi:hypothetical protein CHELA40_14811 [Chelatococcus asaccharovorans]|nr:hypothetical protein CHELA40_14811 [Chelatococcus asaccharovorans]